MSRGKKRGLRPLGKRRWRFPLSRSSGGCWLSFVTVYRAEIGGNSVAGDISYGMSLRVEDGTL
jgi:hypothetical protein